MNENQDEKLTDAEKRELMLQVCMQAIPYVGSPLATLYFGAKQERLFKRLESFYSEIASEILPFSIRSHPSKIKMLMLSQPYLKIYMIKLRQNRPTKNGNFSRIILRIHCDSQSQQILMSENTS